MPSPTPQIAMSVEEGQENQGIAASAAALPGDAPSPAVSAAPAAAANATIADILDRAADLIEPEGAWTKGEFENEEGCLCAVGSIAKVLNVEPWGNWNESEYRVAREALIFAFGSLHAGPEFNDAPERTQAEVVSKLREAATLARKQGQ